MRPLVSQAHQLLFPTQADVKYGSDVLGIPNTNLGKLPWAGGMPNFSIANFVELGASYTPLEYKDPIFEYTANAERTIFDSASTSRVSIRIT
jgi:hypothetical protein